jgi:hypothetical protein
MKGKKVKFKGVLIAIGALVAFFGLIFLLRENETISEFITQNLTRHMSDAMGKLTSKFTFSFLEVGFIALVISAAVLLILGIVGLKRKKFKAVFKGFLIALTVVIACVDFYMLTVGVTYYRAPIDLPIYGDFDETYGADEVQHAARSFLYDYDNLYNKLEKDDKNVITSPYSLDELNDLLHEEFKRLDGKYFFDHTPRVKAFDNTWFLECIGGIGGIEFVPFGEANIDATTYKNYIPSLMAHEIAHTRGVMRENEANLVAAYILITSENEYLRYCGYLDYIGDLADAIRISDVYESKNEWEFRNRLVFLSSSGYLTKEYSMLEYHILIPFFKLFTGLGAYINDLYLKFNGAENGVESYKSPYGTRETGEMRPDGRPVVKPIYSDLHKLFFSIYEEGRPWLTDVLIPPSDDPAPSVPVVKIEVVKASAGSLYLSMGEGFVIITPENIWTFYTTDKDGVNRNETIEPFFEVDFDALPESLKVPEEEYRTIRHGNYLIQFGEYKSPYTVIIGGEEIPIIIAIPKTGAVY